MTDQGDSIDESIRYNEEIKQMERWNDETGRWEAYGEKLD